MCNKALADGTVQDIKLEDEQGELDFIMNRFPLRMRKAVATDKFTDFPEHLVKMREFDLEEDSLDLIPDHHVIEVGKTKKTKFILDKVPAEMTGLEEGDTVLMPLGGSGDYLAFAMSVRAEQIGAKVLRIPPRRIKEERGRLVNVTVVGVSDDHDIIKALYDGEPGSFYPVTARQRDMIEARETFRAREHMQQERKSCAMRVRQRGIGETFVRADGLFPQGSIEKRFDELLADDDLLDLITRKEKRLETELAKFLERIPVYNKVFGSIEGVGPVIAAGIICTVGDIRLFVRSGGNLRYRAGKLKKYCGACPGPDGKLLRKTAGKTLPYTPGPRQAIYKFAQQMIKRPGSDWGVRLVANKAYYAAKHPIETLVIKLPAGSTKEYLIDGVTCRKAGTGHELWDGAEWHKVVGKRKHFKGHLHKMAIWKTLTEFVEHLYDEWTRLEGIIPGQGGGEAAAA